MPPSANSPSSALRVVSFNVAGWKTTIEKIRRHHGSLSSWLLRHGIDVLALQEVKVSADEVSTKGVLLGAVDEQFDTFWAVPTAASSQRQGLNGVATFARKGLTASASANVFADGALDSEGRCIMTDHGAFVLFNVYVPYSGFEYVRLPFKMKFLEALRRAMQHQRSLGKSVILAGDLNVTSRGADCCREARSVNMDDILLEDSIATSSSPCFSLAGTTGERLRASLDLLRSCWPAVRAALQGSLKVQEQEGKGYVTTAVSLAGRKVQLGRRSAQPPTFEFTFKEHRAGEGAALLAKAAGCMSVEEWRETFNKLCPDNGVGSADWAVISDAFGDAKHSPCAVEWLRSLSREDGMVDSFAAAHPHAQGRYTCWNQQENCRYSNSGARLDYIFVDAALWELHTFPHARLQGLEQLGLAEAAAPLAAGAGADAEHKAALVAATANGLFKEASVGGGGIPDAHKDAYDYQFGWSGTSIIYTPPEFSDHVAVSVVLTLPAAAPLALARDKETKAAQPHVKQTLISGFFGKAAAAPPAAAKAAEAGKRPSSGFVDAQKKGRVE